MYDLPRYQINLAFNIETAEYEAIARVNITPVDCNIPSGYFISIPQRLNLSTPSFLGYDAPFYLLLRVEDTFVTFSRIFTEESFNNLSLILKGMIAGCEYETIDTLLKI